MKRRTLLKRIALGSAATNPLSAIFSRSAIAQSSGNSNLKTLFLFHPNGAVPDIFFPQAGTMNLPAMTRPLESVKEHLLFLDGIGYPGTLNTHEGGTAKCLRGQGGNTSIEVQMGKEDWANRQSTQITVPSIQMGVATQWGDNADKRISFDNGQSLHPVDDPRILYAQLFGSNGDSNESVGATILSTIKDELNTLQRNLGQVERERLELHANALSVLESKINGSAGTIDQACSSGPDTSPVGDGNNQTLWRTNILETVSDIQQDIIVQALSCNMTRTIACSYGVSVSPIIVPGTRNGDHDLSHQNAAAHTTSKIWWMGEFRKLIEKMANTPDVNGSLLDNTIICTVSDLGHGNRHDHYRIPMFLAGGKNAGLITNRSFDLRPFGTRKQLGDQSANSPSFNHGNVLTTIAEKTGYSSVNIPTTEGRMNNLWAGGNEP